MSKIIKKYFWNFIVICIIVFGIILRLKGLILNPSMWHDECALAWNVRFKSFTELFGILRFMQMGPPMFLVSSKVFINIFGYSEIVYRLVPFISGSASIVLFYFLSKKCFQTKLAIIMALILFSINVPLINYSFEFKPYEIDVFLTILSFLIFINLYKRFGETKVIELILYAAYFVICPWFSIVSVFTVAGGFLSLIIRNFRTNFKNIFLFLLPVAVSYLIFLKNYVITNYNDSTGKSMLSYWASGFLNRDFSNFLSLIIENIKYLFYPAQFVLLILILIASGVILFFKEKINNFIEVFAYSFLFIMIFAYFHIYPFQGRLTLYLMPIIIILIVKSLDYVHYSKKMRSVLILALFLPLLISQLSNAVYFIKTKTVSRHEFPRESMQFMVNNLKKDDIIFVNGASNTEFAFYSPYYNIPNKVYHAGNDVEFNNNYIKFLRSLPKNKYYWFYMPYDSSHFPINAKLSNWLKDNCKVLSFYKLEKSYLIYVYLQ